MPQKEAREDTGLSSIERAHREMVEQEKKRARHRRIVIIAAVLLALSLLSIALNLFEIIK